MNTPITTHQGETVQLSGPEMVLSDTLNRLMAPLARLCLAHGVTFPAAEEILKQVFVQEADALQPGAPDHGAVSRISTATGINRREVTRLTRSETPERQTKPPLTTELFARWSTDPALRDNTGIPRTLKRQGPAPSFEALAQSITRDVHPRSLLDELLRLGLALHDEESDSVSLERDDFVPNGDIEQMLGLLRDNIGDHMNAAVANVLPDNRRHLEQAVFADELSTESVESLNPLLSKQWKTVHDTLVPVITALIEADRIAGRPQDQRIRIGLYTFSESAAESARPSSKSTNRATRKPTKGAPK